MRNGKIHGGCLYRMKGWSDPGRYCSLMQRLGFFRWQPTIQESFSRTGNLVKKKDEKYLSCIRKRTTGGLLRAFQNK
jgi:hypothetical protein